MTSYEANLEYAEERYCIMSVENTPEYITFTHIQKIYGKEISDAIKLKYSIVIPDVEMLKKYLEFGINLIPTKPNKEGNFYQIKNTAQQRQHDYELNTWLTIHPTQENEIIKITNDIELMYWIQRDIKRFVFIPKASEILCIDIDRGHSNNEDGLKNLNFWLKHNQLNNIPFFENIESGSFPVYTKTPNGGFHLYFKYSGTQKMLNEITKNVEIKYGGNNLTAAGSVKNGKIYTLHGTLDNMPNLIAPLAIRFIHKDLPRIIPYDNSHKSYITTKKKKYSIEQCIEYGRQNTLSTNNHNIIFQMAIRMKQAGYSKEETITAIEHTLEHQIRKNKQDTRSCITSIYN